MRRPVLLFAAALAGSPLIATRAVAQPASLTVSTPIDPAGGYAGPFGSTVGTSARFAQTFRRPAAGFDVLRQFTFFLGDNATDRSGARLTFRAAIYAVTGPQLGPQLFMSAPIAGSANSAPGAAGFDAYTFTPAGLRLDPGASTFAFLLEAIGTENGGADVIAMSPTDYALGSLYTVDATGLLTPLNGIQDDAAFTAVFDAAPAPSTAPEPTSIALVAGGLAGVAGLARRRRG